MDIRFRTGKPPQVRLMKSERAALRTTLEIVDQLTRHGLIEVDEEYWQQELTAFVKQWGQESDKEPEEEADAKAE